MNRMSKLNQAQMRLLIKRNEKWCTALHNEDCSAERRKVIERNIRSAQLQIQQLAITHGYSVAYNGINPTFTCLQTFRNFSEAASL